MSKKTLLEEATVRRFMKLANVSTLSDQLISEMGYGHMGARDEEEGEDVEMADEAPEAPEDMGHEEGPAMADEAPEADADEVEITEEDRDALAAAIAVLEKITGGEADAGGEEMDMGMDEPMADEPELDVADEEPAAQVDLDASEAEALLSAIGDAVSEVTGLDVTVSGDAEEEMPEEPVEAPMDAPLEDDELAAADISLEETTETETVPTLSEEDLVNEVTRRVAERLIKLANQ